MSAYRDESGIWRYDFEWKRKRYGARGFRSKQEARAAEQERRHQLLQQSVAEPYPTWGDLATAYVASRRRVVSRAWAYQLERKLAKWCAALWPIRPREVRRGHIEAILGRIYDENSAKSANEYRAIIVAVMTFAVDMGAVTENVAAKLPAYPEQGDPVVPIEAAHLGRLILAADERLADELRFLSQTGARFVEMARLRKADCLLDQPSPVCLLRTRKHRGRTDRTRLQPLTSAAAAAVRRSISRSVGDVVFSGATGGRLIYRSELKRLHALCDRLGIPRYSFHQVRHYVATVAVRMGRSRKAVAAFLGQSSTGATERYLHAAEPEAWDIAARLEQALIAATGETQGEQQDGEHRPGEFRAH